MNSNEEFKTKFIYDVSSTLNLNFDEQKKITDILSVILVDYEINKKVTELAVSLLENAPEFVPIPEKLKEVLIQLRQEGNE